MFAFLADRSDSYLDEVALAVWDELGVDIDAKTVWTYLDRRRWSKMVAKERAAQRSLIARVAFESKRQYWTADQLCFVDESGACERTGFRKRAWAPIAITPTLIRRLGRGERWNILPALTIDGYLPGSLVIQGSINREAFRWWLLERVIPQLTVGMIIIMDNVSFHHGLGLEAVLPARGISIEYLPPYSPDFNPIEPTFHTLKQWVQQHIHDVALWHSFDAFLLQGMEESVWDDMDEYWHS